MNYTLFTEEEQAIRICLGNFEHAKYFKADVHFLIVAKTSTQNIAIRYAEVNSVTSWGYRIGSKGSGNHGFSSYQAAFEAALESLNNE